MSILQCLQLLLNFIEVFICAHIFHIFHVYRKLGNCTGAKANKLRLQNDTSLLGFGHISS